MYRCYDVCSQSKRCQPLVGVWVCCCCLANSFHHYHTSKYLPHASPAETPGHPPGDDAAAAAAEVLTILAEPGGWRSMVRPDNDRIGGTMTAANVTGIGVSTGGTADQRALVPVGGLGRWSPPQPLGHHTSAAAPSNVPFVQYCGTHPQMHRNESRVGVWVAFWMSGQDC